MRTPARYREELDALMDLFGRIDGTQLIIVEGRKDHQSLSECGIDASILIIGQMPLFEVVEKAVSFDRSIIILADLDAEGRKIHRYLYHHLTRLGAKVDNRFREFLFRETPIRRIEDISKYVKNLAARSVPAL